MANNPNQINVLLGNRVAEYEQHPSPNNRYPIVLVPYEAYEPANESTEENSRSDSPSSVPNWTPASVRERNRAMFNNELMADVHFLLDGKTDDGKLIPAHKYVLATGSSVFYAMFYGALHETKDPIHVPDVEPAAFLNLLAYLYCEQLPRDADTVLGTLYAAKKYMVSQLVTECIRFLSKNLTEKNAAILLCQSTFFEEKNLMENCWEIIDAQAEQALTSEGFGSIGMSTLKSILDRETIMCGEMTLILATWKWADAECSRRSREPTDENKRAVLGDAYKKLRFPTLPLSTFADEVVPLGILTPEETIELFLYHTSKKKPAQLSFPTTPRSGLQQMVCHRFQSSAYRSNQWRYRGRCDSIKFHTDKRIFLRGIGLYGSSNGPADYSVRYEVYQGANFFVRNDTRFSSDGSSNTFPIYFPHAVRIEPRIPCTINVTIDGAELSYYGQDGLNETRCADGITFTFQGSCESTNGTGVQGGQIPDLIYYAYPPAEAVSD